MPRARCSTPLDQRIDALTDSTERELASRSLSQLRDVAADVDLPVGSWHGDWTPWNLAPSADRGMLVWDWERFASGVPVGYDALHYSGQVGQMRPAGPAGALTDTRRDLAALLTPFGVTTEARQPVFVLYLVELLVRYTEDAQARMTIGRRWVDALSGCLESLLADLGSRPSKQRKAS